MACAPNLKAGQAELVVGDTTLVFATVAEGRRVLGRRDDFVKQLSPFDRAVRLKTDREVSESEFLLFVRRQVLAWTEPEKDRISSALDSLRSPGNHIYKDRGRRQGRTQGSRGHVVSKNGSRRASRRQAH